MPEMTDSERLRAIAQQIDILWGGEIEFPSAGDLRRMADELERQPVTCDQCKWWGEIVDDHTGRLRECMCRAWCHGPRRRDSDILDNGAWIFHNTPLLTAPKFGCIHGERRR